MPRYDRGIIQQSGIAANFEDQAKRLNETLRRLSERIAKLEGRSGEVVTKNSLTVSGDAELSGDTLSLRTSRTPAVSASFGKQGDICWDSGYIYVCVTDNVWKRATLSSW